MRDLFSLSLRAPNYQAKESEAARASARPHRPRLPLLIRSIAAWWRREGLHPRVEAEVLGKGSFSHPTPIQRELIKAKATLEKMGASAGPFFQKAEQLGGAMNK